MRNVFIHSLGERARENRDLFILSADLGYRAFEDFQKEFPGQFINVGVAESNMVGVAAGMALSGKTVCIYSIVPFVTLRCLEQIRNNICYHNLNIKVVGVGGSFSYGPQGYSHNTTEDISVMRSLPNMRVYFPGTKKEAEWASAQVLDVPGPAYIRLGKASAVDPYEQLSSYLDGQVFTLRKGADVILISTGNILESVIHVADILSGKGLNVGIVSMPCLKPFDNLYIKQCATKAKLLCTIEEHSIVGGLGSAVAEALIENLGSVKVKRFALPDQCFFEIGSQQYLRDFYGLSVEKIEQQIYSEYLQIISS